MRRALASCVPVVLCGVLLRCAVLPETESDSAAVDAVRPRWTASVSGPSTALRMAALTSTVAIVGGSTFVAGLDLRTGRQLWTLPVPFLIPYAGVAVVNDQLAAVVSGDGFVSFNPTTGAVVAQWQSPRLSNFPSQTTPQILSNGRIVFASHARQLIALDAATGRLDTLVTLPGDSARSSSVSALTAFGDTLYAPVATDSRRGAALRTTVLYRFAVASRQLDSLARETSDSSSLTRWMRSTLGLLVSATDYGDPSWLGFDRKTGERRWKVPARAGSLGPSSQAALVGDTMFAGGNDGQGYVFLVSSGNLVRTFAIPDGLVAGVAACGTRVFVNVIGELVVVGRDNQSRAKVEGLVDGVDVLTGGFAVAHGTAVIGGGDGKWYAFDCT